VVAFVDVLRLRSLSLSACLSLCACMNVYVFCVCGAGIQGVPYLAQSLPVLREVALNNNRIESVQDVSCVTMALTSKHICSFLDTHAMYALMYVFSEVAWRSGGRECSLACWVILIRSACLLLFCFGFLACRGYVTALLLRLSTWRTTI